MLETPRLCLRPLEERDAEFILELLNDPAFIANIGASVCKIGTMQRKRPTRLPRDRYVGERTACFDMCIESRQLVFQSPEVVGPVVERLERAVSEQQCVVPVYVFMPDHCHIMVMGLDEQSDSLAAVYRFRMLTGKWLHSRGFPGWQQSFWDHVMRVGDDWRNHATYLAMNPVRAGLVENYFDYPYLGSIGCDLQDVVLRID